MARRTRHAAAVVALVALPRAPELPAAGEVDQPRLERVVIPRRERLPHPHVVADPAREPGVRVEAIRRRRARTRRGHERVDALDQRLDGRLPRERFAAPRRAEVPPVRERPAGAPQPLHGVAVIERRATPERAPQSLGGPLELGLDPAVEGAAIERLRLRLGEDLKARVDERLHRALVEEVVAEAVDRAHARLFQMRETDPEQRPVAER